MHHDKWQVARDCLHACRAQNRVYAVTHLAFTKLHLIKKNGDSDPDSFPYSGSFSTFPRGTIIYVCLSIVVKMMGELEREIIS